MDVFVRDSVIEPQTEATTRKSYIVMSSQPLSNNILYIATHIRSWC